MKGMAHSIMYVVTHLGYFSSEGKDTFHRLMYVAKHKGYFSNVGNDTFHNVCSNTHGLLLK